MILDKIFILKIFTPHPHPPNCSFSFYGRMFGVENTGVTPSEIPLQETFLCCFRRTIFLNSNPFIVWISRKGILNKVNKSSTFQGKFAKYCHFMQTLVRFWLFNVKKRWCLNVDYLYLVNFTSKAGKVNVNSKKSQYSFWWEMNQLHELRNTKH